MAPQKSRRQSRKRRRAATRGGSGPAATRTNAAARHEPLPPRPTKPVNQPPARESSLRPYGERPPSPFGGLPVSEIAIFAGGVGLIVGLVQGGGVALVVGLIVCTLGVLEVCAREHFSGYRSHTLLLAMIPAIGVNIALVAAVGQPRHRLPLVAPVIPIFAVLFWLLRRRFQKARHTRVTGAHVR